MDYILYRILFALGSLVTTTIAVGLLQGDIPALDDYITFWLQSNFTLSPTYLLYPVYLRSEYNYEYPTGPLNSVLFWAGLAPSIWMWLYVLALFVTRGLLR